MMSSLQCCVENEVLQRYYAQLNEAINDPVLFGAYLVQYEFAPQATVDGIVNTLGFSNPQKASKLLEIVGTRIRTATSKDDARHFFNQIVLIFAHRLNRADIADALIATCSK